MGFMRLNILQIAGVHRLRSERLRGCIDSVNGREQYENMPRDDNPFRQPLKLIEHRESFEIASASGRHLAYIYFEDEPGRRDVTKRITREDARRLAVAIHRLPELLDELRSLRAADASA